jgi:hypothetical protein
MPVPRRAAKARQRHAEARELARKVQVPARTAATYLGAPWAQRVQPDVTALDLTLAEQARMVRPAVRWWWGERRDGEQNGAYDYLCDRFIATWHHRWPIPKRAGQEIVDHRDRAHGPALSE